MKPAGFGYFVGVNHYPVGRGFAEIGGTHLSNDEVRYLSQIGMPLESVNYIQSNSRLSIVARIIWTVIFLLTMFVPVFAGIVVTYSLQFTSLLQRLSIIPGEAVLVNDNYIFPLLSLFAWIPISGVVILIVARFVPRKLSAKLAVQGVFDGLRNPQYQKLMRYVLKYQIQKTDSREGPEIYFRNMHITCVKMLGKIVVPIVCISSLLMVFELCTIPYTTNEGVSMGRYFSIDRKFYPWKEVEHLSIGCYRSNGVSKPEYQLHFPDGHDVDLFNFMKPVNPADSKLELVASIDKTLRVANVPREESFFTHGIPKDESKYDLKCLQKYKEKRVDEKDWVVFERVFSLR